MRALHVVKFERSMKVLGIETSCDETAAAVYDTERGVCSSVLFSQIPAHHAFGGVVPELASRSHIEKIPHIVSEALTTAFCDASEVDVVAVTTRPGLPGSLLVGVCFAKALAYALNRPIVGVDHLEGHIASAYLEQVVPVPFPHLCLTASGGHTALYIVHDYGTYELLGRTADDAAGEAFDKVARLLGFGYPGGAVIEQRAKEGGFQDYRAYPRMRHRGMSFSFSGIKTAVLYDLVQRGYYDLQAKKVVRIDERNTIEVASSLLVAIGDIFLDRIACALAEHAVKGITFVGGVAANRYLTQRIAQFAREHGYVFASPSPCYCTDNAAMIAYVGHYRAQRALFDTLAVDIAPRT